MLQPGKKDWYDTALINAGAFHSMYARVVRNHVFVMKSAKVYLCNGGNSSNSRYFDMDRHFKIIDITRLEGRR